MPPARFNVLLSAPHQKHLWRWVLVGLVLVGIGLRWINLETKVFWVDEVATAVRVGGYTQTELTEAIANTPPRPATDLWQTITGDIERPPSATLQALIKSPEHAPLYFLLAREWAALFGRSAIALRSLSVCLSLLSFPALVWLCLEWLALPSVGGIALAMMAVSPLFISYAQEARPYSLWLLLLLLSGGFLLRAMRRPHWIAWCGYGLSLTLALYTSLLSVPIALAQALYVWGAEEGKWSRMTRHAGGAIALSFVAFLPWVVVILTHWDTLQRNTAWMQQPLDFVAILGTWIYGLSILIFDVPVAPLTSPIAALQILTSTAILAIFGLALWKLIQRTPFRTWGFVLALALPTPLLLILADLAVGGQRSTAPRYWMAAHLGLVLILAGWYSLQWHSPSSSHSRHSLWSGVLALLLIISLASSLGNIGRSPRYLKSRNLHNGAIATYINQTPNALVVTESENLYDLISLSRDLTPAITVQVLSRDRLETSETADHQPLCQPNILLFNPSQALLKTLQSQDMALKQRYIPQRLTPTELALTLWHPICQD